MQAEEQLWRQKTEKSTRQNIGDVTELKIKLDNQLKDAYRDISTFRAQAVQLTADLDSERARREKAERELLSVQDAADQLSNDLAEARLENGHLTNLSTQSGGTSSLMQELAEARQQAERAIRMRDRAQDQVLELEEACAELEKLAAPDSKALELQGQMKLMNEQKVSMMEKMIKEESRNFDEAVSKVAALEASHAALEAERDDAMVQVQRLQVLIKELRSDTNRASRGSRRSQSSLSQARSASGGDDRWAGRSAYATEALVQAALRMTQIETENERLRQQLQSRHEASRADGESADTIQSLRRQLEYAEEERDQLQADLEARGPALPDDTQMTDILLCRQTHMNDMKGKLRDAIDFVTNAVRGGGKGFAAEAQHLKERLLLGDTVYNADLKSSNLPEGWETMFTPDGIEYFVDHNSQRTQWVHPSNPSRYDDAKFAASPGSAAIGFPIAHEQQPLSATSAKLEKFKRTRGRKTENY